MKVETGTKERIEPFENGRIKVDFGEKTIHSGKIDMRLPRGQMIDGMTKDTQKTQGEKQAKKVTQPGGMPAGAPKVQTQIRKDSPPYDESGKQEIRRGQKLPLPQELSSGMKLGIRLLQSGAGVEIDSAAFMVDGNGKTGEEEFIFYNNPKSPDGSVSLTEGSPSGYYSHFIEINALRIPARIQKIAVTLTCDGGDFSGVKEAKADIIDEKSGKVAMSFDFSQGLSSQTGIVVLEVYKRDSSWRMGFVGSGFEGGLEALCRNYGIDVE